jgi:WD40 repeat protein
MKTLEKERNRRYDTCSALADDVKRYLNDQPVEATLPSTAYYVSRFVRRNRYAVIGGSVFVSALAVAALITTVLWLKSQELAGDLLVKEGELEAQVEQLQDTAERLRASVYQRAMGSASQALRQSNLPGAYDALESQMPSDDAAEDQRGLEWYVLASMCKANQGVSIAEFDQWCISQDRRTVAMMASESVFTIDVATATRKKFNARADLAANSTGLVAISNDRSRLVSRITDGLRIDDTSSGKTSYVSGLDQGHSAVAISPDGALGANATSTGNIQVWKTDSGEIIWSKPARKEALQYISFTEDSNQLVTVLKRTEHGLVVWDARNGEQSRIQTDQSLAPEDADFLDQNRLVMGGADLKIVDLTGNERQLEQTWLPKIRPVYCLAISQDGKLIALGTSRHSVQVWNLEARSLVWQASLTHRSVAMQFADGDTKLLIATMDGLEQHSLVENLTSAKLSTASRFYWPDRIDVLDGTTCVLAAPQHRLVVWNPVLGTEQSIAVPTGPESLEVHSVAFDPTSSNVAVVSASTKEGDQTRVMSTIDLETGELVKRFAIPKDDGPFSIDFFSDGKRLASGSELGAAVWNTETGQAEWRFEESTSSVPIVRISPDNSKLAGGNWTGNVYVWDVSDTPSMIKELKQSDAVFTISWSPDNRWLVAGDASGAIVVYDTKDFSKHVELRGHSDPLQTLTFSPDGTVLFSGALDGRVKLWNVKGWFEVAELNYDKPIHAVRCISTSEKQRIGILVGTRENHDSPADVKVHWVDIDRTADGNWLRKPVRIDEK